MQFGLIQQEDLQFLGVAPSADLDAIYVAWCTHCSSYKSMIARVAESCESQQQYGRLIDIGRKILRSMRLEQAS